MQFLNPGILFGLLAVSIPVLIHLFNLRKVEKVQFSTLMFIKELQKSKLKKIKLKQLILLLLRCLVIIFLVLSFSKPVFKGYAGGISNTQKTVLIYIDDSFSMNVKDERGLYFDRAKRTVESILKTHSERDEVYLIPTSTIKFKNKTIQYNSFRDITDSLKNISTGYKDASISEVNAFTSDLLGRSKNLVKEIYVISDFQRTNFPLGNEEGETAGSTQKEKLSFDPENTGLYLINIGQREANNLSLDGFLVASRIIDSERDVRLSIDLTNHSKFNVFNKTVILYVDGKREAERVLDAGSLSKTPVEFTFKPGRTGSINGYIELVQSEFLDDEIREDNKYYFSLFIPESYKVGIIEGGTDDSRFIRLALSSVEQVLQDSVQRPVDFINISQPGVIDDAVNSYDALFISNKSSFSQQEADALKKYLENGGGVFIFPGSNTDINNYNSVLLSTINSARVNTVLYNDAGTEDKNSLKFGKLDFEHPLLSDVFKNPDLSITTENTGVESPQIRSYFELLRGENSNSIISLNNNKEFLIESKIGDGKIIISSVPASTGYSDFPLKSLFAPIIIRSVFYFGNNFDYQKEYTVGKVNIISTRNVSSVSSITLPSGEEVNPNVNQNAGSTGGEAVPDYFALPYEQFTKEAGIYTLSDSAGNTFSFALNKDPLESNLEKLEDGKINDYFSSIGYENIQVVSTSEELQVKINQARFGLDLWLYLLIAAILCLLAEIILAKKLERE